MNIAALADKVLAETGIPAVIRCSQSEKDVELSFACPQGTTEEQEAAVFAIVQEWPAEQARIDALLDLDKWFADSLNAGYETEFGWRLGLQPNDVTLLTGHYVLAREAAALGLDVPPLIDADGVPRPLDVAGLTRVMLGYGSHRASLSAEYASRAAEIRGS